MVISTKKLSKLIIKHDGNQHKAAKEAGISQPAISNRLKKNPQLSKAILNVREEALKRAECLKKCGLIKINVKTGSA